MKTRKDLISILQFKGNGKSTVEWNAEQTAGAQHEFVERIK